jgi:hypothetical protein
MSNVSSSKLNAAASISMTRQLRSPFLAMRSRAFSSIPDDRSMPVIWQARG